MELEQMSSAELIDLVKLQEAALKAEQARYESLAQAFPVARESVHVTASELSCVINWLENGRDPKDAAKELRLYRERASAAVAQQGGGELPQDERAQFQKEANEARFFPAEISFERTLSPSGRDEYKNSHLQSRWEGWQARAALAQRAASVPAQAGQKSAQRQEANAFENWAKHHHYDMTTHPLHWLFLDKATYAARHGWKAGIAYAVSEGIAAPVPAASVQPGSVWQKPDGTCKRWCGDGECKDGCVDPVSNVGSAICTVPPAGWHCTRAPGHDGPCAAEQVIYHDEPAQFADVRDQADHDAIFRVGSYAAKAQPDTGRDAALEMKNAIIAVISYGHLHDEAPTAKFARQLLGAIERDSRVAAALATQAAPEVASVPDAGDEPVGRVWLCREDNFLYAKLDHGVKVKLGDLLYTRPQPAPAVVQAWELSDGELADVYRDTFHYSDNIQIPAWHFRLARAVLAAAAK